MEEETILKISTNYKFKKREFLHLNNNGYVIEDENKMLYIDDETQCKITNNWFKIDNHLFVYEKDYNDNTEYEGVVIETTKQTVVLGISLEKGCCEEFGSGIVYPDNLSSVDFIGKKVQKVAISLDWDWNEKKGLEFKEGYDVKTDYEGKPIKYHSYDEGGSVTIRIYTDLGIIKIYVYNIYRDSGDYKHNYFLSFYDYEDQDEL